MGLKSPFNLNPLAVNLSKTVGDTLKKYREIILGYSVSMVLFIASSVVEVFDPIRFISPIHALILDKVVFGTMMFSVFMLAYFVREQERVRFRTHLEEQERVKDGIRIAESEIRNQIILIHQAAYVMAQKQEYDGDMVRVIRDNTVRMNKQLELLQSGEADPRDKSSDSMLILF